jgi:hypothetical protein
MFMRFFVKIFLCLLICAPVAQAQDSAMSNSDDVLSRESVELVSVNFDDSFRAIDNPFLSDVMKLNYQVALLNKMVARQAVLQKISQSYESLGVHYEPPLPPRGICAQMPPNTECIKAYPDLYQDIRSERKEFYKNKGGETAAVLGAQPALTAEEAAELAKQDAMRREKQEKEMRRNRYQWSDISCAGSQCRGVIVAPSIPGVEMTVYQGIKLNDGTVIESISAQGIKANMDGEIVSLRPMQGNSNENIKDMKENNLVKTLNAQKMPEKKSVVANQDTKMNKVPNTQDSNSSEVGEKSVDEPTVGPSGLF